MSGAPNVLYIGGVGLRCMAFVSAWRGATGESPLCLSYASLVSHPHRAAALAADAHYIRFDSPDRDSEALASALMRGKSDAAQVGFAVVGDDGADALMRGAIGAPAQLAFGLAGFAADLLTAHRIPASLTASDLLASFDKTESRRRFVSAGLPAPEFYGNPRSFDEVRVRLPAQPIARAFLKLRHGSSAAGMMAIERRGQLWRAMTTAFENSDDELCASRDLKTFTHEARIGRLIDRLAPQGLHLEAWVSKFSLEGMNSDLRIVLSDDDPFIRVRRSATPMTNLHLGAERSDADGLRRRVGDSYWQTMLNTARRAAAAFPGLKTAGIDIAFLSHPRQHVLFEINAFGSFVKDGAVGPCLPYQQEAKAIARNFGLMREAVQ